jgi:hypothetical protein
MDRATNCRDLPAHSLATTPLVAGPLLGTIFGVLTGGSILGLHRIKAIGDWGFGTGWRKGFIESVTISTLGGAITGGLVGAQESLRSYCFSRETRNNGNTTQTPKLAFSHQLSKEARMIADRLESTVSTNPSTWGQAVGFSVGSWALYSGLGYGIARGLEPITTLKLGVALGAASGFGAGGIAFFSGPPTGLLRSGADELERLMEELRSANNEGGTDNSFLHKVIGWMH